MDTVERRTHEVKHEEQPRAAAERPVDSEIRSRKKMGYKIQITLKSELENQKRKAGFSPWAALLNTYRQMLGVFKQMRRPSELSADQISTLLKMIPRLPGSELG